MTNNEILSIDVETAAISLREILEKEPKTSTVHYCFHKIIQNRQNMTFGDSV
jgi:hypothetical protein